MRNVMLAGVPSSRPFSRMRRKPTHFETHGISRTLSADVEVPAPRPGHPERISRALRLIRACGPCFFLTRLQRLGILPQDSNSVSLVNLPPSRFVRPYMVRRILVADSIADITDLEGAGLRSPDWLSPHPVVDNSRPATRITITPFIPRPPKQAVGPCITPPIRCSISRPD